MVHQYIKEKTKEFSESEKEERFKYLGKEVIDVGDPGLDSIPEFYGIANAIWRDWNEGKITTKTAIGRLLLLKLLTNKNKNHKIKDIPEEELDEVRAFIDYVVRVIRSGSKKRGEPEEERSLS
ncbi:hypothetical protein TCELL_0359 [Thermogladius calderae 1633]|uniref:Uncharacterized protein n=1 Tax=Thermogladius calderae (strain DSM 22663 / VKM B-2946 / 1633) TaxID=1184251 RepID=I3TDE6_THEC1|nr:hypothetical protein [Thermogladius calderae]AFK50784.1 hypothetical protein TCELL_0359 [Thermogladius calderae 1633]